MPRTDGINQFKNSADPRMTRASDIEIEVSNQCAKLIANAIIF